MMGTLLYLVVSAAVIYMARLEESMLDCENLVFYKRFILFLWKGNLAGLCEFLWKLNNLKSTIQLTWEISTGEHVSCRI